MLGLGLIGCGAIGSAVIKAILGGQIPDVSLLAVLRRPTTPSVGHSQKASGIRYVATIEEMVALAPDLVFEVAGHEAVVACGPSVVAAGIDLMLMSVGALANADLRHQLTELAIQHRATILIPSGAIGGLDLLRAGGSGGQLEQVDLTCTKHPSALAGQPYVINLGRDLLSLNEPLTVFDGSAADACPGFPKSANIAAAVSLAGVGFDRTRVCIVADPGAARTMYTLEAKGSFGEMRLTLRNIPHPRNPRTSFLACLGAVAAIKNVQGPFRFI